MSEVIEPSEILIDEPFEEKIKPNLVNPWIRFISRMVDYALLSFLLLFLKRWVDFPMYLYSVVPMQFFLWIPFEVILLSSWGYTPGKFLLKTKVRGQFHQKLSFKQSLKRSFSIWVRGLGLGISFLSILTMLVAFFSLKLRGASSWDREEKLRVEHLFIKPFRLVIAVALIIVGTIFTFLQK